eukprot:Hpha_TRINITY_DN16360_c2_g4::TRINITY_DN16360_c2_g4_i1::g.58274::m.58274
MSQGNAGRWDMEVPVTVPPALKEYQSPDLAYIRVVDKTNSKGKKQKRVLVVTPRAFVICDKGHAVKRFFDLDSIDEMQWQEMPRKGGGMERRIVLKMNGEMEHDLAWTQIDDKDNPKGASAVDNEMLAKLPQLYEAKTGKPLKVTHVPQSEDIIADADRKKKPGYTDMMDKKMEEARRRAQRARDRDKEPQRQPSQSPDPASDPPADDEPADEDGGGDEYDDEPPPDIQPTAVQEEGEDSDGPQGDDGMRQQPGHSESPGGRSQGSALPWQPQQTLPLNKGRHQSVSQDPEDPDRSPLGGRNMGNRQHSTRSSVPAGGYHTPSSVMPPNQSFAGTIYPGTQSFAGLNMTHRSHQPSAQSGFGGSPGRPVTHSPSRRSVYFDGVPNVSMYAGGSRASTPVSVARDHSLPVSHQRSTRQIDPAMMQELQAQRELISRLESLIQSSDQQMQAKHQQMMEGMQQQPPIQEGGGFSEIQRQLDQLALGMAALQQQVTTNPAANTLARQATPSPQHYSPSPRKRGRTMVDAVVSQVVGEPPEPLPQEDTPRPEECARAGSVTHVSPPHASPQQAHRLATTTIPGVTVTESLPAATFGDSPASAYLLAQTIAQLPSQQQTAMTGSSTRLASDSPTMSSGGTDQLQQHLLTLQHLLQQQQQQQHTPVDGIMSAVPQSIAPQAAPPGSPPGHQYTVGQALATQAAMVPQNHNPYEGAVAVLPPGKYLGPFPLDQPTPEVSPRAHARQLPYNPTKSSHPATRVVEELLHGARPGSANVWNRQHHAGDALPPPSGSEWAQPGAPVEGSASEWASAFAPRSPAARIPPQPSLPAVVGYPPQLGSEQVRVATAMPASTPFDEVLRRAQRTTLRAHIATAQAAAQTATAPPQSGPASASSPPPQPSQPQQNSPAPPSVHVAQVATRRMTGSTGTTTLPPPYMKPELPTPPAEDPEPDREQEQALQIAWRPPSIEQVQPAPHEVAVLDELVVGTDKLRQELATTQAEMDAYLSREIAKIGDLVPPAPSPPTASSAAIAAAVNRRESDATGSLPGVLDIQISERSQEQDTRYAVPPVALDTTPREPQRTSDIWQPVPDVGSLRRALHEALSDVALADEALPRARALHAQSAESLIDVLHSFVPNLSRDQLRRRWAQIVLRYVEHARQRQGPVAQSQAAPPPPPAARVASSWTPAQLPEAQVKRHSTRPPAPPPVTRTPSAVVRTQSKGAAQRARSRSIDDSLPPTPPARAGAAAAALPVAVPAHGDSDVWAFGTSGTAASRSHTQRVIGGAGPGWRADSQLRVGVPPRLL